MVAQVLEAIEGRAIWLGSLAPGDLPPDLPAEVDVLGRRNEVGLRFNGIVGTVKLADSRTIHIIPKIGRVNFLRLFLYATGGDDLLKTTLGGVPYELSDEAGLSELVATEFVTKLEQAMRHGLDHQRKWRDVQCSEFGGRVDLVKTAMLVASRQRNPVVARKKMRTQDTAEHRMFLCALERCQPFLNSENQHRADRARNVLLRHCSPKFTADDLETAQTRLVRNHYRGPRSFYRELVSMSQILLGISGIKPGESDSVSGSTFLLRTAPVFEAFVRRCVQDALHGTDYVVLKGGTFPRSLYVDGSFELEPDVVVERMGQCQLILDAKYKEIAVADHYQMLSYIDQFQVLNGALIRPCSIGESSNTRAYRTITGAQVDVVSIDLSDIYSALGNLSSYVLSQSRQGNLGPVQPLPSNL